MSESTIKGRFVKGMKIGNTVHRNFEMRAVATMSELFKVEQETSVGDVLSFNGAMMAAQLTRVGDVEGPFLFSQIGDPAPVDYDKLRQAQGELDKLGK